MYIMTKLFLCVVKWYGAELLDRLLWTVPDYLDANWVINEFTRPFDPICQMGFHFLWVKDDANEDRVQFPSPCKQGLFHSQRQCRQEIRSPPTDSTIMEVRPSGVETQSNQAYHHSDVPVLRLWISTAS